MDFSSALIFDYYSGSFAGSPDGIISLWKGAFPNDCLEPSTPKNGFERCEVFLNPLGEKTLSIMYGGATQNGKVNVFASGDKAENCANFLRSCFPDHDLVRADVALDFNHSGAWAVLVAWGVRCADMMNVKNSAIAPAGQLYTDSPDIVGRTLYLGSRQSVAYVRIYEKGKKDNPDFPDWVRVELEFKPKGKARSVYAKASKLEIVNATWAGRLFKEIGCAVVERPCPAGTVRSLSDFERSLSHLRTQYKKTLERQFHLCNGDYELLGRSLVESDFKLEVV